MNLKLDIKNNLYQDIIMKQKNTKDSEKIWKTPR